MKKQINHAWTACRRRLWVTWKKLTTTPATRRLKKPSRMTVAEEQAVRLWKRIVVDSASTLLYQPEKYECFAEWSGPEGHIYLFLEEHNLRVINTVVGYDVRLSSEVEGWCSDIFYREVSKRRRRFRAEAEAKVTLSLDTLEHRLTASLQYTKDNTK